VRYGLFMVDLRTLHEHLSAALGELEALTQLPTPDEARLARVRYCLSKASGERRRMVDTLYAEHVRAASGAQAQALEAFRRRDVDLRIASVQHITAWTLQAILADWRGYCRASARMRHSVRQQIEAERAIFYPDAPAQVAA
jgi:hypothetical protein